MQGNLRAHAQPAPATDRRGGHHPLAAWRSGRGLAVAVIAVALGLLAAGLGARLAGSAHPSAAASRPVGPRPAARTVAVAPRRVASRTSALSLDQLAGQRIIYAYAGLQPPASLLTAIRDGEAGGVIFFGPNIASVAQIRGVIDRLQQASLAGPLHDRLLMLTDQEGGEVRRLPGAPVLSERRIGAASNGVALAGAAGRGAGTLLRAAGINVNLAPVLDVYRSPGDFIDAFQRSYSRNPAVVARLGGAFIAAAQATGVAATAKHFPGLGAAPRGADTDLAPVTLNVPLARLRSVDEAPYRTAIAAGVKLVMVSWARYPALDRTRPAGLSPTIIGGELRRRLGFHGVTITDGIDAGAVAPYGDLARRSVLAARAGADLILCAATQPQDDSPAQGTTALHALATAIAGGELSRASALAAAARILALRAHP